MVLGPWLALEDGSWLGLLDGWYFGWLLIGLSGWFLARLDGCRLVVSSDCTEKMASRFACRVFFFLYWLDRWSQARLVG